MVSEVVNSAVEGPIDKASVARHFNRAAPLYLQHAVLQQTVCERLEDRLQLFRVAPEWVLDLGCGPGNARRLLGRRYPRARVLGLDLALCMLQQTPRDWWWRRGPVVCADAERLPLADASVDFIFSNLMFQWCLPPDLALAECRRVLRPDGLLLLSSLGPDTLKELRASWRAAGQPVSQTFVDLHDLGDALIRQGFASPVVDAEHLTLTYRKATDLLRDLRSVGAGNARADRSRGLTGPRQIEHFAAA
jgi:malonyl-CoA O-methyltransferase